IRVDGRSGNAREGAAVEEVAPPRKRCRRRLHGRVRGGSGAPGDSGRGADERAGSANRACPYERRSLHVADSPWSWWPLRVIPPRSRGAGAKGKLADAGEAAKNRRARAESAADVLARVPSRCRADIQPGQTRWRRSAPRRPPAPNGDHASAAV